MGIFGSKEADEAVSLDTFMSGAYLCSGCKTDVPLDGLTSLALSPCPHCKEANFVPCRVAGFWLFQPLGGGGMGSVYKAHHENTGTRPYAVKVLPREGRDDPLLISALQAESQVVAALGKHNSLVSGVSWGFEDNEHFLAADFVNGERLDKYIDRKGKVPEDEIILIALRLLSALHHVYKCGYLFRDMKPQNVIIHADHGAYLFDFGISMGITECLQDQGDMIQGSPLYFPPERLTGDGERTYSEVYSLGMVLYHALAGRPYFTSKELDTVTRRHLSSVRLAGGETKMKDISSDIVPVLEKMIRREPQMRYQHFVELEAAWSNILRGRLKSPTPS